MPLYESTFIARQDLSQNEVEKLTAAFSKVITDNNGSVVNTEYWGLRNLAYIIEKNRKGHYVMLAIDAPHEAVKEMERRIGLNEDVIRNLTFRVDGFSEGQSPMMGNDSGEEIPLGGSETVQEIEQVEEKL